MRIGKTPALFALSFSCLVVSMLSACSVYPGRVPDIVDSAGSERETIATQKGEVIGSSTSQGRVFLGIPYAAPPTGTRRWRPPQPVKMWETPRDASKTGSPCIQAIGLKTASGGGGGIVIGKEDCLYLNVYAPPANIGATGKKLPVMVFLPGGAFLVGAADNYNPMPLARSQDVVVVTVNYRLGAFGYLAHHELTRESPEGGSGNFGLLDQQAALRWVRDEIAAFGGDPKNVTLFGESAGAWSACYQMVSPAAKGLFHRVILQSGSCTERRSLVSLPEAERGGADFVKILDCDGRLGPIKCLRTIPADRIARSAATRPGLAGPKSWGPVWGDQVVPLTPAAAFTTGRFSKMPAIVGSNLDEGRLFSFTIKSEAAYKKRIRAEYGDSSESVMRHYPIAELGSPSLAYAAILTDSRFACPAEDLRQKLSRRTPVYGYEFADRKAPFRVPTFIVGQDMGAYHSSELTYVFGSQWPLANNAKFSDSQKTLSARMMNMWGEFAHGISPDVDWPAYSERWQIMKLEPSGIYISNKFSENHHCDLWNSYRGRRR